MALIETLDLTLSADRAKTIVGNIAQGWQNALDARQVMDQRIAGYWLRYEARPPKRTLPFTQASNIRVPLTLWTIFAVWVRFMRTVFGQRPYLGITDDNLSVPPDAASVERMVQHLSEVDLNLRFSQGHVLLNGLVGGTGVAKLIRDDQSRNVRDRVGDVLVENTVIDRVGLGYEVIDHKDFAVANPSVADVNKQPWVSHRVWLRWDDILRRQRDGIYTFTTAQMSELKSRGKTRRESEPRVLDQVKADIDRAEDSGWSTQEEWEFLETLWRYDADGDGLEEECLFTVALDYPDAPARSQVAPGWSGKRPYLIYRPRPRANRFYGQSPAGILQPIQDEADTETNQSLDASTFTILANLTPIIHRSFKKEWESHKWILGKPLYVDTTPEQFRTVGDSVRYPIQLSTANIAQLFAMAERALGVADTHLGKPTEGSKTAYEIASVQSEGNISFNEMIEQIQLTNAELGYQIIEQAYQLQMESLAFRDRLVSLLGKNPFDGARMQDIRRRIAVRPTGNTLTANKDLEARKWLGIFQMFKDDILVTVDLKHGYYLRRKALQAMGAEQEADQIIGTADEVEQAKQLIANSAQHVINAQMNQPGMGAPQPTGETPPAMGGGTP